MNSGGEGKEMRFLEGDVFRLSRTRQARVPGEVEPIWLAEGTFVTVAQVLGDWGYELEAFVHARCRHVLVTVSSHEIGELLTEA
ncbi:hypothetical protein [Burkholderia ubonensis]|uniref:Uncharacterized protein n=1 Tax=Burkholderia ubonensis TaxID=101571 RepID=A0A119J5G9_9BURK|nr:hypothetical protein [Burkholderia ubonensis]KWA77337.1 hypothetical protein WL29_34885 [Burkholderia ubonensis]KWC09738.1 hypothetical protein WL43_11560 [Burkholderia ubonensis]KWZ58373.1 hypothetical protein WK57_17880 [Burkholderia ubonensis]